MNGLLDRLMPNIGVALYAGGSLICVQYIRTSIIDAYTSYAVSAFAATTFLRSLAAFGSRSLRAI